MHPVDILYYGHQTVLNSAEPIPVIDWDLPGAAGVWSVRDIIAHLTSYENLLVEIFQTILVEGSPTLLLAQMADRSIDFNESQVKLRESQTPRETRQEYEMAFQKSFELAKEIPAEMFRKTGLLAWYGDGYDLEDFLVYTFYGHKREHSAQINAFRDILEQQKATDIYA